MHSFALPPSLQAPHWRGPLAAAPGRPRAACGVRPYLLSTTLQPIRFPCRHRIGVDRSLLRRARHVLLVREPAAVIGSFAEVLEPTLTVRGPAVVQ